MTDTQTQINKTRTRELRGEVVSTKMTDTVVVRVTRFVRHARYGKYIAPSKRYKAHDSGNQCRVGDTVLIREARPMSRDKRFVVVRREKVGEEVTS